MQIQQILQSIYSSQFPKLINSESLKLHSQQKIIIISDNYFCILTHTTSVILLIQSKQTYSSFILLSLSIIATSMYESPTHLSQPLNLNVNRITKKQFYQKYFLCQKIGHGSYASVYRVREKNLNKFYAIKIMKVNTEKELQFAFDQIHILDEYEHPYVVKVYQYYVEQSNQKSTCCPKIYKHQTKFQIGIIMQLALGNLQNQIKQNKKMLGTSKIRKSSIDCENILENLCGIIDFLTLLERNSIVHRDIKPDNILLFNPEQDDYARSKKSIFDPFQQLDKRIFRWALSDFGLSINLSTCSQEQRQSIAGSFEYCSPLLKKKFTAKNIYHKISHLQSNPFKDDVYSLGVCMLQLITGYRQLNQKSKISLREILCQKNQNEYKFKKIDAVKAPINQSKIIQVDKFDDWQSDEDDYNDFPEIKTQKKFPQKRSLSEKNQTQIKAQYLIFQLINMMLKEKEEMRPCFIELQEFIRQKCKQFRKVQKFNSYKKKQSVKTKKYAVNLSKSIIADSHISFFNTNKSIRSLLYLEDQQSQQQYLLCGCHNGQVFIVKLGDHGQGSLIIQCGKQIHNNKYIGGFCLQNRDPESVHIKMGKNDNKSFDFGDEDIFLSYGGDGAVLIWSKPELLKSLLYQVKTEVIKEKNMFKKPQNLQKRVQYTLKILQGKHFTKKQLPSNLLEQIKEKIVPYSLFQIDLNHYVIGYSDGSLIVVWDQVQQRIAAHHDAVTSIKLVSSDCILSSSLDNTLKILNINHTQRIITLSPQLFVADSSILFTKIFIENTDKQPIKDIIINIVTLEQQSIFVDKMLKLIHRSKIQATGYFIDAINFQKENDRIFALSQYGEIIDITEQKIIKGSLITKGWNCLASKKNGLIYASFQGVIAVLTSDSAL